MWGSVKDGVVTEPKAEPWMPWIHRSMVTSQFRSRHCLVRWRTWLCRSDVCAFELFVTYTSAGQSSRLKTKKNSAAKSVFIDPGVIFVANDYCHRSSGTGGVIRSDSDRRIKNLLANEPQNSSPQATELSGQGFARNNWNIVNCGDNFYSQRLNSVSPSRHEIANKKLPMSGTVWADAIPIIRPVICSRFFNFKHQWWCGLLFYVQARRTVSFWSIGGIDLSF